MRREKNMACMRLVAAIFFTVTVMSVGLANATLIHSEYSKPILDPATQPHWVTGIPNALADYFTFTPYASDAAAVAAGFPSGVCGTGTIQAGPWAGQPQEDCYSISVREFQQDLGLKVEGSYVPGVSAGTPLLTSVWGYGSANNAPTVGPFTAGVWHFPAPTFRNTSNKPARITWANELPNTKPAGFDPTYDCGPNAPDCFPYNRIVTHVHGAHVADDSDGYATAWYSPLDPVTNVPIATGPDYLPSKYGPPGTYRYENTQEAGTIWYHDHAMGSTHLNTNQGMAGFFPITDDNEKYLQGLTIPTASLPSSFNKPNPGPKLLPTGQYELGFALQDRNFWPDGSLAMPDLLIYNLLADSDNCSISPTTHVINPACPAVPFSKNEYGALIPYNATITAPLQRGPFTATGRDFAACTPDLVNGGVIPDTCPEVPFSKAADGHLIAYSPTAPVPGPFTASSGTLEYFGYIPVVNGVVFGKYDIEPRMYRMRFIGGTDSRAWIMQLQVRGTGNPAAVPPVPDTVIPFWQIATEQGFVKNPIMRTQMVLMPGERLDVLVDFSSLTAGQKVVLANLGGDMPYGGELMLTGLPPAPRSVDIPEIMEFSVPSPLPAPSGIPEVAPKPAAPAGAPDGYVDTAISLRPLDASSTFPPVLPLTPQVPVRNVSLIEITDQYGRTMPTIDSRGFMPMGVPITEVIKLGDTEQWDIINSTVDSHPMHLHLISFQLIDRVALPATIDPVTGLSTGFTPPVDNPMAYTFTPPSYVADAAIAPIPPAPWELGWKDTIECPPGYVTRVKAKFDIPGLYVWHCHILSHEEHDMMRPMAVTTPAGSVNLTASTATASQLSGSVTPVTFTAAALTTIPGYAETGAFEYQFSVTPPSGVTVTQPTIPATLSSVVGTTSGYFMSRQAVWTPPAIPGTYAVTVRAKGLGPVSSSNAVKTASLNYIITGAEVAGVTSTTLSGAYRNGAKINVNLTFNQNVSSTNGLTIALNSGATLSTGRMTDVSSFSGTYTVASGHNTPPGKFLEVTAITGTVTDAVGNTVNTLTIPSGANLSGSRQITIDNTPPVLTITNPASTLVNNATQTVAGTVSDLNGIQSLTVNGSLVAVGSNGGFSTTVTLVSGANTLSAIVTDLAGNQTNVVRNITLDTVPPVTTVSPAPGTFTGKVTVSLTSSKIGSTIYYTTNGTQPTTASPVYTGPFVLSAAATTTYSVLYFSVDPAGNTESIKTADFVVHVSDLTASVTINNGALLTKSAGVTLNLAASDPVGVPSMQVACDGTTFGATEPFATSKACTLSAGDGVKTAAVKFIDSVGTVYAPVTAQITLDTTLPAVSATPGSGTFSGAVSVELTANEAATIYYTTNGSTPTTASSVYAAPIQLGSPSTVVLALAFMAVDQAGNAGAVQTLNYTIHQPDLAAAMTINSGVSLTASQNVMLYLTATDPAGVTEMQVACDGINFAPAEPYAVTRACVLTGGDGLKTVLAKFRDGLGNWYPSINAQITLDTTAPATSASPLAGTYSNSVTVVLNASETSTIYYTTDGTDPVVGATPGPAVYTGPLTFSPAATTTTTVKYLAVDQAGNAEAVKSIVYTVHVNDLVGSILINGGAPYTPVAAATLTLAASDPATVTEMQFSNDGVSYTPFEPYATTRTWTLNGGDGVKTVYVRFKDGVGTVYAPYSAEITLAAAAAVTPTGDLNGDASVNLADALRALQVSAGLFQPTVNERVRGDVAPLAAGTPNPDGVIDSGDVLLILKRILALASW